MYSIIPFISFLFFLLILILSLLIIFNSFFNFLGFLMIDFKLNNNSSILLCVSSSVFSQTNCFSFFNLSKFFINISSSILSQSIDIISEFCLITLSIWIPVFKSLFLLLEDEIKVWRYSLFLFSILLKKDETFNLSLKRSTNFLFRFINSGNIVLTFEFIIAIFFFLWK